MIKTIEKISSDYDKEMTLSEKLSWEVKLIDKGFFKDFVNENYFLYYKISSSIKKIINQF